MSCSKQNSLVPNAKNVTAKIKKAEQHRAQDVKTRRRQIISLDERDAVTNSLIQHLKITPKSKSKECSEY